MEFFSREKFTDVIVLAQIFAGSIIVGILCLVFSYSLSPPAQIISLANGLTMSIPGVDPLFKFLFKELGFALIISGLIGTTIDFFTKRRHEESANKLTLEMQKNIFHALISRDLPPKLYEAVKQNAFNAKFYRTEFRVFYELGTVLADKQNPDPGKYIKLSEQTSFVVKNITKLTEKYIVNMYMDPCLPGDLTEVPPPQYEYVKVNQKDVAYTLGEKKTGNDEVNAHYEFDLSPGETAQIDSSSFSYVRLVDEQVFSLNEPTEALRITTSSHAPDLQLSGYVLCGKALDAEAKFKVIRDTVSMKEWSFDHCLLPGQGFLIKWKNIA